MPYSGLGARHTATATKAVNHGAPVIEDNIPGIAFKTTQLDRFVRPNSTAAVQIIVGESFVIMVGGIVEAANTSFAGGVLPARGDKIYIVTATNLLTTTVSTNVKYGIVTRVDAARNVAYINTEVRDAF